MKIEWSVLCHKVPVAFTLFVWFWWELLTIGSDYEKYEFPKAKTFGRFWNVHRKMHQPYEVKNKVLIYGNIRSGKEAAQTPMLFCIINLLLVSLYIIYFQWYHFHIESMTFLLKRVKWNTSESFEMKHILFLIIIKGKRSHW